MHPANQQLYKPSQVVTISFFRYTGLNKIWALQQMQVAQKPLSQIQGLLFFKMLGSGYGNGFSIRPDFSTFALLCNWDSLNTAQIFFHSSQTFMAFKNHTVENWTIYMHPIASHGKWSGISPFEPTAIQNFPKSGLIGVITRATLYPRHLLKFWKQVPAVSNALQNNPGLIFTKGIGELPIIQQATFSLWASQKDMMAFAYQNPLHTQVIKKTRELGWYKEELFARFKPFNSEGTWNGRDLLADY